MAPLLLLAVIFFAAQNAQQTDAKSWSFAPPSTNATINGKRYLFSSFSVKGSLSDAHSYCAENDMYLVSFDSAFEFEAVQQRILQDFSSALAYWTSGFRRKNSTTWGWTSTKRLLDVDYLYWRQPDQPDLPLESDVCLVLQEPDYEWFDEDMSYCQFATWVNFICEAFDP